MAHSIHTEIDKRGKSRALTGLGGSVRGRNGDRATAVITTLLYGLKAVVTAFFSGHTLSARAD